ncbi:MAG: autoinducer binding domain-containing protein [Kordiimonas sp.]
MSIPQSAYVAVKKFMREVGKISSLTELTDQMALATKSLGIEHIICVSAFGFAPLQDRTVMFGSLHTEWIEHYGRNKYYIDDALSNHALTLHDWGEPVWWTDFISEHDLTVVQRKIFKEAFDFGLKEGIVVPIPVASDLSDNISEYAFVTMGGDVVKSDELENTLRLLAIAAHGTARRIYLKAYRKNPSDLMEDVTDVVRNIDFSTLTHRQKEILSWICEGEGPSEVAERLGVTVGTVNDHIKAVKRKYGFVSTGEMTKALHRHRIFI